MNTALKHQKRGQRPTLLINANNGRSPFPIPRLNRLASALPIGTRNNYFGTYDTHLKASFVKVIYIYIMNPIFGLYIAHQLEPHSN
jgi:hypothetical protein